MKFGEIVSIVEGTLLTDADPDMDIQCICASDLMSDVLAFSEPGSILLTGLCNPQVVRTVEMADIAAIVFVRDKHPPPGTVALAKEKGIPLVTTPHTMFEMCGRLYKAGLRGPDLFCRIGPMG